MNNPDIPSIAAGLTKAQRDLLCGHITGQSYRSYKAVGAALVRKGLLAHCLGGFFEATETGQQVRAHLLANRGNDDA
jgi:hypothetical protein